MLPDKVILYVGYALSVFGVICLLLSIVILARQAINKNVETIAKQTTKLAEKGITDGASGLVGNASLLINSLNELSRSTTGIGIFFVFLSLVLLAGAYYFLNPFIGLP